MPKLKFNNSKSKKATFAFAHGAGVGMDSDFMEFFAKKIAKSGIRVARFEFPYMEKSRSDGKRRPPDKAEKLVATFREVVTKIGNLLLHKKKS